MRGAAWVYVGCRSGPESALVRARLDVSAGRLDVPEPVAVVPEPAWLAIAPDGRRLYTCSSAAPGDVRALAIDDPTSGALRLLNQRTTDGPGPSHLSLDRTGGFLLAANYHSGFVEVFALAPDGRLGTSTARVEHHGRSVHPERQTAPHVHCVGVDPSNRFVLAADLGLDRVSVYRFDAEAGALAPHTTVELPAGSGPRHLAWHPDGRHLLVSCELASAVACLAWNAEAGVLTLRDRLSVLPADFAGANTAAEIVIHPDGRVLYVSNRGHDSLAVCRIGPEDGALTLLDFVDARGRMPRYMVLDATARWLLVASHDSDSLGLFDVSDPDGGLSFVEAVPVRRPYGLAVLPIPPA